MLINPTVDMLRELGLYGMATAFQELDAQSEAASITANGLPCCSNARRPCAARSVSRPAPGLQSFAMTHRSRMPTFVPHAVSTAICSWRLPAATGSESITVFSSPGRRAWARAGWPVRLATKLAERISPSPITGFPGCLQHLPSREATDVMAGSSSNSPNRPSHSR